MMISSPACSPSSAVTCPRQTPYFSGRIFRKTWHSASSNLVPPTRSYRPWRSCPVQTRTREPASARNPGTSSLVIPISITGKTAPNHAFLELEKRIDTVFSPVSPLRDHPTSRTHRPGRPGLSSGFSRGQLHEAWSPGFRSWNPGHSTLRSHTADRLKTGGSGDKLACSDSRRIRRRLESRESGDAYLPDLRIGQRPLRLRDRLLDRAGPGTRACDQPRTGLHGLRLLGRNDRQRLGHELPSLRGRPARPAIRFDAASNPTG